MPLTSGSADVEECKKMCDEKSNCTAIEYSPDVNGDNCCFLLACKKVPVEPTLAESIHHPELNLTYVAYVKEDGGKYGMKDMFWTAEQCTDNMIMPLNTGSQDVTECEKKCNEDMTCNAIEYAATNKCCVKLDCQESVPEPTLEKAIHHGGTHMNYEAYVKVMSQMNGDGGNMMSTMVPGNDAPADGGYGGK